MTLSDVPLSNLLVQLEKLVDKSLKLWDLPKDVTAELINVSENFTYLIENSSGFKAILRVHRENYHSRRSIECELAWIDALSKSGLIETPSYFLVSMVPQSKSVQSTVFMDHATWFYFIL